MFMLAHNPGLIPEEGNSPFIKRKSTKQTGRKNLLIHNLTGHAVDDLFELVITVGRMISGRAFEDVFDAAEAHAFA